MTAATLTERVFEIPTANLAALETALAKLARRAERLGVPAPTMVVGDRFEREYGGDADDSGFRAPRWTVEFAYVEVRGDAPKYDGWTAAAVIDLDPDDQPGAHLVHVLGGREADPTWRAETDRCDHCSQAPRGRKTLIVVEHNSGERRVVGSTCVKDFLGHQSPEQIASWFSVLATLDDLVGAYEDLDFDGPAGRAELRADPLAVLDLAAAAIDTFGWVPRSAYNGTPTADLVIEAIFGRGHTARDLRKQIAGDDAQGAAWTAEAEAALDWALTIDPRDSDYLANVQAVAGKAGWRVKDFGLGVSMLAAYRREQERLILRRREAAGYDGSVHVGAVGEKISLAGMVAFTTNVEGAYGPVQLVKILTDDGNLIVWWNSGNSTFAAGEHVSGKATVKRHETDDRSGKPVAQTTVTRAKLTVDPGGLA